MIAIIGALKKEFGLLLDCADTKKEFIFVISGIGRRNAEVAARILFKYRRPDIVVSIGFAGAIGRELKLGDIVVCRAVFEESSEIPPITTDTRARDFIIECIKDQKINFHLGDSLTVSEFISDPAKKAQIGTKWPVSIIEMESYWVALECLKQGIPFSEVRVVSDAADEDPTIVDGGEIKFNPINVRAATASLDNLFASFLRKINNRKNTLR